jgi:hypothetical protein
MNGSPTGKSSQQNRPASALGGGGYQPRATYNHHRHRDASYGGGSPSGRGSPPGGGGGGGGRGSLTPTAHHARAHSPTVVLGLPPSSGTPLSSAGMSPGLRMLEQSVNRAHAASLRRPRSGRPASSRPAGAASPSSPRAAALLLGGNEGGGNGRPGTAQSFGGASTAGSGHNHGPGLHLVTSHSPYALARFPEQPPKMAERITARDAEKTVVALKADFNTVAEKALKMAAMLEKMKEEEVILLGSMRVKKSDAGAVLEHLKLRFDQVAWEHEVAAARRATHDHVIARIQRATVETAAEVNTLRGEVAAAARANDGELIRAQHARDAHTSANEQLAAKEEECEVIRGGYAAELEAMKQHSLGELEVYAYHDERNVSRAGMEKRMRAAPTRRRQGEAGAAAAREDASEALMMVHDARWDDLEEAFSTLSRLTNSQRVEGLVEAFVGQDAKRRENLRKASELEALSKRLHASAGELQTRAVETRLGVGGGGGGGDKGDRKAFNDASSAADASDRKTRMAAEMCVTKSKLAEEVVNAVGNLIERLNSGSGGGNGGGGGGGGGLYEQGTGGGRRGRASTSSTINGETSEATFGAGGAGAGAGGGGGAAPGGGEMSSLITRGKERLGALEASVDAIVARVTAAGVDVMHDPHNDDGVEGEKSSSRRSRGGGGGGGEKKKRGSVSSSKGAPPSPTRQQPTVPSAAAAAVAPSSIAIPRNNTRVLSATTAPGGGARVGDGDLDGFPDDDSGGGEEAREAREARVAAAARFLRARRGAVLAAAPTLVDTSNGRLDLGVLAALCRDLGAELYQSNPVDP